MNNKRNVEESSVETSFGAKIKKLALSLVIILVAIAALVIIGARIYFRTPVRDYYKASSKAFLIPGLTKGFVPQGLDFDARSGEFFITGYFDEKPCIIYRVDAEGKNVGRVSLNNVDGSDFMSHAGGIAIHDNYVYIAGGFDNCLYVFDYDDIMNANFDGEVDCIGRFNLESGGDYITVACMTTDEDGIYISEFYREENYPTADGHHVTTRVGNLNTALTVKYDFSNDYDSIYGLASNPSLALSTLGLVQGIEVDGDNIYLSTSYGAAKSTIYKYDRVLANRGETIDVLGGNVPLLELDSAALLNSKKIPPMSEEIKIVDKKMYTMCESASNKYFFGKLTGGEYCYATDLSFFDK